MAVRQEGGAGGQAEIAVPRGSAGAPADGANTKGGPGGQAEGAGNRGVAGAPADGAGAPVGQVDVIDHQALDRARAEVPTSPAPPPR